MDMATLQFLHCKLWWWNVLWKHKSFCEHVYFKKINCDCSIMKFYCYFFMLLYLFTYHHRIRTVLVANVNWIFLMFNVRKSYQDRAIMTCSYVIEQIYSRLTANLQANNEQVCLKLRPISIRFARWHSNEGHNHLTKNDSSWKINSPVSIISANDFLREKDPVKTFQSASQILWLNIFITKFNYDCNSLLSHLKV